LNDIKFHLIVKDGQVEYEPAHNSKADEIADTIKRFPPTPPYDLLTEIPPTVKTKIKYLLEKAHWNTTQYATTELVLPSLGSIADDNLGPVLKLKPVEIRVYQKLIDNVARAISPYIYENGLSHFIGNEGEGYFLICPVAAQNIHDRLGISRRSFFNAINTLKEMELVFKITELNCQRKGSPIPVYLLGVRQPYQFVGISNAQIKHYELYFAHAKMSKKYGLGKWVDFENG